MMDQIKLIGGPADGRKLEVNAGLEEITVAATERSDPTRPRRRRGAGRRDCRYRRTSQGVGTGLIPRRYEYVPPPIEGRR